MNRHTLQAALHKKNQATLDLDIDTTEAVANKADAQWTYQKNRGYMPMVDHLAEVGQIVSRNFRPGNASLTSENLEFIQQCEQGLSKGMRMGGWLRIDETGYQQKIIEYCDQENIQYTIRATFSQSLKVNGNSGSSGSVCLKFRKIAI